MLYNNINRHQIPNRPFPIKCLDDDRTPGLKICDTTLNKYYIYCGIWSDEFYFIWKSYFTLNLVQIQHHFIMGRMLVIVIPYKATMTIGHNKQNVWYCRRPFDQVLQICIHSITYF